LEKIAVIIKWAQFITIHNIREFLEFCEFYWKFIKDYNYLIRLLEKFTYKNIAFSWAAECEEAF